MAKNGGKISKCFDIHCKMFIVLTFVAFDVRGKVCVIENLELLELGKTNWERVGKL